MNISVKNILLLLLASVALASCIRDDLEDCPPLRVEIGVKDKNYFNVDQTVPEERLADDLAFNKYVPTLFYMLRDAKTGEVVEEQGVFNVEGDGKTVAIDFCPCLPHGKYILTVWGGLDELSQLSDDRLSMLIHPDKAQGNDVYLLNATLVYDAYNYDYTLEMERIKGKLVVLAENLPDNFDMVHIDANNLYGKVNANFEYSDEASVCNKVAIASTSLIKTATYMAPSIVTGGTVLDVNFVKENNSSGNLLLTPDDVKISLERNKITMLKYVFNKEEDKFYIYIKVNDNWEVVHGMILD
ncbi:hypothetical protein [Prevotella sp.]|uniref:hypothetical protein n=1 Tax=Prevotella sp. TaxID=59823 RepID=UPI0030778A46